MINHFIKNVIPFLVPYLFSLKIEEYQNMGDCNQAGPHEAFLGQIPPRLSSAGLLFVESFRLSGLP